jgi:hypothetical protein
MKKHLLTLFSLLLLSTTVTLAQTGGIVDITGAGTSQGMNINEKVFGRGLTMPVGNKLVAGATGEASLHLRSDALVMEVTKTEMVGDDFVPRTTELWSIPFPNPAKELAFTPQGELIVRGENNQILFNAMPGQPGELLKLTPTGELKIDARDRKGNLYILWKK